MVRDKENPVPRALLSESIYNELKKSIFEGSYQPGDRLAELKIAEQYETSQGPVREALQRLEQDGLITRIPYRGAFVAEISEKEIKEIFELRALLESVAIKWFIKNINNETLDKLEEYVIKMREAALERDLSVLLDYDILFHEYICKATGSETLYSMWSMVNGKVRLAIASTNREHYQQLEEVSRRHKKILDKISKRDVKNAVEANNKHFAILLEDHVENFLDSDLWLQQFTTK